MTRIAAFVMVAWLWSLPLAAQDLSPQVDAVASGGAWQAAQQRGRYRVVVSNFGGEHVVSAVRVDWLAELASPDESPRVVATAPVPLPEPMSVSVQLVHVSLNRVRIVLSGTSPYSLAKKTWSVHASTPGVVSD